MRIVSDVRWHFRKKNMNIDLTKGSIANILIIGLGLSYLFVLICVPDYLNIFLNFNGYLLSLLLGLIVLPFIRLTKVKFYKEETESVISAVELIINKTIQNIEISSKISRPIYDLFLRIDERSDALIKRIHDLDQQSRFIYSLSRLFFLYSLLLPSAFLLKLILIYTEIDYYTHIYFFLKFNIGIQFVLVFFFAILFLYLSYVFKNSAKSTLVRLRNFEKMAIINNDKFFEEFSRKILLNTELVDELINKKFDKIPHAIIQP